uniref:phosphoribosylaminoimidazolesuccinocarboxamide synthase n=1 Tax=Marseillevirus LCMAC201 TaxID=2506605 RepID=A0A481YXS1_9VIRU|nr:MAG: formyl transferase [Marseillevirus LCMAC201]
MTKRILIFISGEGTNLQAIIDATDLNAEIVGVISNKRTAAGIQRAAKAGIPVTMHEWDRKTTTRAAYDQELLVHTNKYNADLIVLAGWMHILSKEYLEGVERPIINLHPALPETFKGKDGIGMAWDAYQRGEIIKTGVMVHHVVPDIDSGAIIKTVTVDILSTDTLETLRDRVKFIEKPALLEAIRIVLNPMTLLRTGKVRDVYRIGYGMLQMVATDRCSAFDRHICNIPHKGYFLNKMSEWWFKKTSHIIPNHYIATKSSSMFVKECTPLQLEVVVRGYITGSTNTSLWTHYNREQEAAGDNFEGMTYCGHHFPAGLVKHGKLPQNVVTPTTKGEEDVPITSEQVVEMGLVRSREEWQYIHDRALELFEYGQWLAGKMGLILVDTKYEFGIDTSGKIILIDELHTCDSSRYWKVPAPLPGEEPQKLDKDCIRDWIDGECDPYTVDVIPIVPTEITTRVTTVYKEMYQRFVNCSVEEPGYQRDPTAVAHEYLDTRRDNMTIVIAGSISDKPNIAKLSTCLTELDILHRIYYASAHKQPLKVLDILNTYNPESGIVYVTCAGMSNALSGFVVSNTIHPVIAHPLFKDQTDMLVNIHSTIQMPSNVPSMTILRPDNVAKAVERILCFSRA